MLRFNKPVNESVIAFTWIASHKRVSVDTFETMETKLK